MDEHALQPFCSASGRTQRRSSDVLVPRMGGRRGRAWLRLDVTEARVRREARELLPEVCGRRQTLKHEKG